MSNPPPPEDRPFPQSLCHRCVNCRYTGNTRGSIFLMCRVYPGKYPPQPVLRCPVFEAKPASEGA